MKLVPVEAFVTIELRYDQNGFERRRDQPYRSMTQIMGETRMDALVAAEASAAKRRPRLEVFHARSWATDASFALSLSGSDSEGFGNGKDGCAVKDGRDRSPSPPAPATDIFERRRNAWSFL